MSTYNILVTGATGKQGRSTLEQLLAFADGRPIHILALTRNANSESARALVAKADNISLIEGNLDDPAGIFKGDKQIHAVFNVQIAMGNDEEGQGKGLVDEAIKHGVKHFVYTSVERQRGGNDQEPTYVPHFITKHHIETHREIPRHGHDLDDPSASRLYGQLHARFLWQSLCYGLEVSAQTVDTIATYCCQGRWQDGSARSTSPEKYKGQKISLAGDSLTFEQSNAAFRKIAGEDMPQTYGFVASIALWMLRDMRLMYKWFEEVGYQVNIADVKKIDPDLMTFEEWLQKESKFPKA